VDPGLTAPFDQAGRLPMGVAPVRRWAGAAVLSPDDVQDCVGIVQQGDRLVRCPVRAMRLIVMQRA